MMGRSLMIGLCAVLSAAAWAVDAPTRDAWAPVQALITAKDPTAEASLTEILRRFPRWPDGLRELARLQLAAGKPAEAVASARNALTLAPGETVTQALLVQALAENGDTAGAIAAAEAASDAGGWARFHAARAAVSAGQRADAERLAKAALQRAGNRPPAEFWFLDSRVALLLDDPQRAERSLLRAVDTKADDWSAWYELGRVRLILAERDATRRLELLTQAEECLQRATINQPDVAAHWLAQGQVQLARGEAVASPQRMDEARLSWERAVNSLQGAVARDAQSADAVLLLGQAELRLERWADAAKHLQQARTLGAQSRVLLYNLALAMQNSGQIEAAAAVLGETQAESAAEKLTVGLNAYQAGNYLLAVQLLTAVAPMVAEDQERARAVDRYLGHAYRHLADAESDGKNAESYRDFAAAAYQTAGDRGDRLARDFFLALETARHPGHAYRAGWTYLGWTAFLSLRGWGAVVGNYGAWATDNDGLAGMWAKHPPHLIVWVLFLLAPMILYMRAALRGGPRVPRPLPAPRRRVTEAPRDPDRQRPRSATAAPRNSNTTEVVAERSLHATADEIQGDTGALVPLKPEPRKRR